MTKFFATTSGESAYRATTWQRQQYRDGAERAPAAILDVKAASAANASGSASKPPHTLNPAAAEFKPMRLASGEASTGSAAGPSSSLTAAASELRTSAAGPPIIAMMTPGFIRKFDDQGQIVHEVPTHQIQLFDHRGRPIG